MKSIGLTKVKVNNKQTSIVLVDLAAHRVGLRLAIQQSSTERHVVVAYQRTGPTASLEELVTQVARLEVHVEIILRHDDEQLADLKV